MDPSKQQRDQAREEIVVHMLRRDSRCEECGEEHWNGRLFRVPLRDGPPINGSK